MVDIKILMLIVLFSRSNRNILSFFEMIFGLVREGLIPPILVGTPNGAARGLAV